MFMASEDVMFRSSGMPSGAVWVGVGKGRVAVYRGVENFSKWGASCLELLLMPLGGSGDMPPQEIFDFRALRLLHWWKAS